MELRKELCAYLDKLEFSSSDDIERAILDWVESKNEDDVFLPTYEDVVEAKILASIYADRRGICFIEE